RRELHCWGTVLSKRELRLKRQRAEDLGRSGTGPFDRSAETAIERRAELVDEALLGGGTEQIGVSDQHLVLSQLIARAQRQRGLAEASWGDDDDVLPACRIADQTPGLGEAVGEELGGGDSTIVKGIVSHLAARIMPKA